MELKNAAAWGINNKNYFQEVIQTLKHILEKEGKAFRIEGDSGSYIIAFIDGEYFSINDNGGEFTIILLNLTKWEKIPYSTDNLDSPCHLDCNPCRNPDSVEVGIWFANIFLDKKNDYTHRFKKEQILILRKKYIE